MSLADESTDVSDVLGDRKPLSHARYQHGPDRYIHVAEDWLNVRLADQQRDLLQSLATDKRTIIMSGNGPGKSYGVAIAKLAFLLSNPSSVVLGTSGSYSQYVDAVWRAMKGIYKREVMPLASDLPKPNDSGQPSLEIDDDWYAKVVSPRDPGDLEGRHGPNVLVVIEEADKSYITDDHFDSARSSVTSDSDRMLAICNPPRDKANAVVSRLDESNDDWNTIQFSTLESHNVRVDAGEIDAEPLPAITDLSTIKDDWEAYNNEPWPGLTDARRMSDPDSEGFREDLDERWYRRRAGVMPPDGTIKHRPITPAAVEAAWERSHDQGAIVPERLNPGEIASAVDVARSGADTTVAATVEQNRLDIVYEAANANHTTHRDALLTEFGDGVARPVAVDAIGEGSGLADMLSERLPTVIRFGAGNEPPDTAGYQTYKSCWAQGLALLGSWLADGGSIRDRKLYEELRTVAQVVAFEERHYASRGTEVFTTTASKSDIKDRLNRSPDRLDAAYMAIWAREVGEDVSGGGFTHVGSMTDLF